jgi:hypothetical protein
MTRPSRRIFCTSSFVRITESLSWWPPPLRLFYMEKKISVHHEWPHLRLRKWDSTKVVLIINCHKQVTASPLHQLKRLENSRSAEVCCFIFMIKDWATYIYLELVRWFFSKSISYFMIDSFFVFVNNKQTIGISESADSLWKNWIVFAFFEQRSVWRCEMVTKLSRYNIKVRIHATTCVVFCLWSNK